MKRTQQGWSSDNGLVTWFSLKKKWNWEFDPFNVFGIVGQLKKKKQNRSHPGFYIHVEECTGII